MDNNNKEVTPREFKVGDVVWDSVRFGKGKVIYIDKSSTYTVGVVSVKENDDEEWSYTLEGKYQESDLLPSLYHQPYRIELLDIPQELPEVGTPVYVWDDGDTSCQIQFFLAKSAHLCQTTASLPVKDNKTHWDNFSLTLPDKFK